MGKQTRDLGLERTWRRRLRDWQRSGLTGRDFCAQHALSEPSFYAWKREIARRDGEQAGARRPAAKSAAPAFVPVRVAGTEPLEVVVGSGRVVRVPVHFDAAHLRAVVAALEAPAC